MSETFVYTGAPQTWVVPAGVTEVTIDAYGAQGGRGHAFDSFSSMSIASEPGGIGGLATSTFTVTAGESLQVNVGGKGEDRRARRRPSTREPCSARLSPFEVA